MNMTTAMATITATTTKIHPRIAITTATAVEFDGASTGSLSVPFLENKDKMNAEQFTFCVLLLCWYST